ncbi:hypothetical protein GCM10023403_19040 [Pseudonocardia benzenivorans]|uniref:Uncharacterized protein n=1 Tax=Pseudonocardia dioxanivorans (strain ATCC 55486 / DSM 44775 / JCM 13855 / CB1190) TaxID=675635 RepID=F4CQN3_PSEUX|nr:hypothetical protein Psed_0561 [Pseudonocardia dioxanivorans CB1190]GJF04365.1 hypothetical protein PSD17_33210 [Pseudonocardia sp. D17]
MPAPALPRAAALAGLLGVVLTLTIAGAAEGRSTPSCARSGCPHAGSVSAPTPATPTPHTPERSGPAAPAAPAP